MVAEVSLEKLRQKLEQLEQQLSAARPTPGSDQSLPRAGRRARGAYFTPMPLVELIAAQAIGARVAGGDLRWRSDGSPELSVLDPAAGDGRFLAAAGRILTGLALDRTPADGRDRHSLAGVISSRCLIGIERDQAFAEQARSCGATIHCAEALLAGPPLGPIDVVLGNPPYQRSIHLARSDPQLWRALKGRYEATSHGEWDLYGAFLEQSLAWLGPRGQVGLVVPSRWTTAAFAGRLRAKLGREAAVRAIVDFGSTQIFAGATTYSAVAFLSRARCQEVDVLRRGRSGWSAGRVSASSLAAEPWRLSVGQGRRALAEIHRGGPTLGEVARIVKGAGTNADRVYIVEPIAGPSPTAGRIRVRSTELDEEVELEAALCRPVYRGRDVRGNSPAPRLCVIPYLASGDLIDPVSMARSYPYTLAYFERCRARLDQRERGRFKGATFYRFGRPQNLALLLDAAPKVIVPDLAREGRAVLDSSAAFVLDSAYALRLRPDTRGYSLEAIAAVLRSPLVGLWLRETGVQLRGGYVRMKTAYLQSMPLPPPG